MWRSRRWMRWRRSSPRWCTRMRNCCAPSSTHSSPQPGASPGSQPVPAAPAGRHLPRGVDPGRNSPGPARCAHSTIPAPKVGPGNAHPRIAPATTHHIQWEQKGGDAPARTTSSGDTAPPGTMPPRSARRLPDQVIASHRDAGHAGGQPTTPGRAASSLTDTETCRGGAAYDDRVAAPSARSQPDRRR